MHDVPGDRLRSAIFLAILQRGLANFLRQFLFAFLEFRFAFFFALLFIISSSSSTSSVWFFHRGLAHKRLFVTASITSYAFSRFEHFNALVGVRGRAAVAPLGNITGIEWLVVGIRPHPFTSFIISSDPKILSRE